MRRPYRSLTHILLFSLTFLVGSPAFAAGSSSAKPEVGASSDEKHAIEIYNKGVQQLKRAKYEEAEKKFLEAIRKHQVFAEAHNNLAFALRKQGSKKFDLALKHYNTAIRLEPELAEAYMYRGVLYQAVGKKSLAKKDLDWLKRNSPKLARELQWVLDNGREKEPPRLFGVSGLK